jgi:hypothetical protein
MVSRVEPENPQQLAAKQANIFVSKGAHKLPFDFVRSSDIPPDKSAPAAGTGVSAEGLWSRVNGLLSSPHALAIGWPFRACIELQATYDLSHVRLVVQAVQGMVL